MSALSNSAAASESPNLKRKANIPGIKDAGKVDEFLYRGAQPSGPWEVKKERRYVRSLGMNFVNLPGNGWSPPSDRQVAEFFRIVQERPRRRIFVHWVGTEAGCLLLYTGLHSIDGRQRRRSKKCTPITSRPFCTQT